MLRRRIALQVYVATLVLMTLVTGCGQPTQHAPRCDVAEKAPGHGPIALHRQQELAAMGYPRRQAMTPRGPVSTAATQSVSPMLFPIIFLAMFGFTASALFVRKLCQEVDEPIDPFAPGERPAVHRLLLVVLVVVGFVYAAPIAGFVLTAAAMLLVLFWFLGANWKANVAVSLALPAALYHAFASYLNAPLPQGWFGW